MWSKEGDVMLFHFFNRKQKNKDCSRDIDRQPKYYIPSNMSNPKKEYELLHEEEVFLDALLEKSIHLKGEYSLSRLSDGTINVSYSGYPIGKIKLQGRKKQMMYMKNLYEPISVEGDINIFINNIDKWIRYIKKYI